jgi:tetratricopeptide (TPR) repeat protein
MGIAQQKDDDFDNAVLSYQKAIELKPDFAEAYNNLGNMMRALGNSSLAISYCENALKINPRYAEAYNNLGNIYLDTGYFKEASNLYKKAIDIDADYQEANINLGHAYFRAHLIDDAISQYERAIKIEEKHLEPYLCLCEAYDRRNQLEEMEALVKLALKRFQPCPSELSLMCALLHFRKDDFQGAIKYLEIIDFDKLSAERKILFHNLEGKIFEKLKDFSNAFRSFAQMNKLVRSSPKFKKFDRYEYLNINKEKISRLKKINIKENIIQDATENYKNLVFLIGFPRSGTTLLDVMLRTHSQISVVEEEPAIDAVNEYLSEFGQYDYLETYPDENLRDMAIKIYFENLGCRQPSLENNKVIIDKLPLNLFQLPLVNYLFPGAKYIFAMRHPLDSIISCWKQVFEPNAAMVNMTELSDIVELYVTATDFILLCEKKLNLNICRVRYEDLVHDRKFELNAVLRFLNLSWEEKMLNHDHTASQLNQLKTPSYHQVAKPIYSDSVLHWLNYEKELRRYLSKLKIVLEIAGYADAATPGVG